MDRLFSGDVNWPASVGVTDPIANFEGGNTGNTGDSVSFNGNPKPANLFAS